MVLVTNLDQNLLRSLGAIVYEYGTLPNGFNINDNCGSTFPNKIKFLVKNIKQI